MEIRYVFQNLLDNINRVFNFSRKSWFNIFTNLQLKQWTKANIVIGARVDFSLELRGTSDGKVLGYLAVDDITYNNCDHGPPQKVVITAQPSPATRLIGEEVSFTCQASGVPTPKIVWRKGKTDISAGGQ